MVTNLCTFALWQQLSDVLVNRHLPLISLDSFSSLSVSSLCVRRCGLLQMLLLSGKEVHWDSLYRLLPRTGPPWMRLGCTGPPWFSWDGIQKRYEEVRWSTWTGLQLSSLTSYRRAEKPKMVSTSSSSPISGLRPRIRGWSVISTEAGLWFIFAGGIVGTPGGRGGLSPGWFEGGGKGSTLVFPVTWFWEEGQKVQIAPIHHQHAKNRRPWILLHVVSGPWTSIVAALDKGQCNKAVCRRYT